MDQIASQFQIDRLAYVGRDVALACADERLCVFAERASVLGDMVIDGSLSAATVSGKLWQVAQAYNLVGSHGSAMAEYVAGVIETAVAFADEDEPPTPEPEPDDCGATVNSALPTDQKLAEEIEREIFLRTAAVVKQWELADPRDRWRHTGEQQPRAVEPAPAAAKPYRTPQSTIDAFFYVASLNALEHLKAWLADHPADAPFLLKLLECK